MFSEKHSSDELLAVSSIKKSLNIFWQRDELSLFGLFWYSTNSSAEGSTHMPILDDKVIYYFCWSWKVEVLSYFLRIEIVCLCFPMTLSCIKYLSVFCHSIMEFHESNLTKCITFLQIHLGDWIGCFSASFSRFKVIFHIFGLSLRQFSAYYELVFGLWNVVVPQRFFGTALGMQRRFFGPWVLNPSLLCIQD